MSAATWTADDAAAGLCRIRDIGTLRPQGEGDTPASTPADAADPASGDMPQGDELQTPQTHQGDQENTSLATFPDMTEMTDAEIAAVTSRVIRTATINVFDRLGAEEWLFQLARTLPKEYLKIFMRMLPQTIDAKVEVTATQIPQAIKDLTIDDLLAMRAAHAADTINPGSPGSDEPPKPGDTARQAGQADQPGDIIDAEFTEVSRG